VCVCLSVCLSLSPPLSLSPLLVVVHALSRLFLMAMIHWYHLEPQAKNEIALPLREREKERERERAVKTCLLKKLLADGANSRVNAIGGIRYLLAVRRSSRLVRCFSPLSSAFSFSDFSNRVSCRWFLLFVKQNPSLGWAWGCTTQTTPSEKPGRLFTRLGTPIRIVAGSAPLWCQSPRFLAERKIQIWIGFAITSGRNS